MNTMRLYALLLVSSLTAGAQTSPAGKWISNLKYFENDNYDRLEISADGSKLTGKLGSDPFEGTYHAGQIDATVKTSDKQTIKLQGRLTGDRIEGTGAIPEQKVDLRWEAYREPVKTTAQQKHTFEPTDFKHHFVGGVEPVLHLNPGDTVSTWTVDAGGTDPKGVRRTSGGNPLTGPFYIDGAIPGDTLVVHFNRIRLNRDTAISDAPIVADALTAYYVEERKKVEGYDASWRLDRAAGFASLQKPTEAMKDYRVPLAPMLGCVGVAPPGRNSYRSGYLGSFGGNMDYNQLREGVTVYLPVYVPGALLYVGDGHAAQGAGELTGDALETSMDVEFTVDVKPGNAPSAPRFENVEYLMASGIDGSLDQAFRGATTNLVRWLEKTYNLNPAEVSSVLGTAMIYDIAEVVDPQVHVVAKVPKSVLTALKPAK